MAKDYLGKPLSVGDTVVFMQLKYRGLMKGTIKKLTAKTAIIEHPMTNTCSTESKQFHDQMIKIETSQPASGEE
jgi:peroxiredoxin